MTLENTASPNDFRTLRPQRIQPLAAFRAFRKLIRNKEDTAQVFEIMRALSGRSVSRGYGRMLRTMEGGRQAFLRDELALKLDDPVWLARFEPGTVGADYRAFREARGFTADGLAEAEREVVPFIDAPHPIIWYSRRLRDVHDIWHVLTGYGPMHWARPAWSLLLWPDAQSGLRLHRLGRGAGDPAREPVDPGAARGAAGLANGRARAWLPGLDYEALFAEPLETARARLGIRPATVYAAVPEADRAGAEASRLT